MPDAYHATNTEARPISVFLSLWIGMVFWIALFWTAGLLTAWIDVRLGILAFAPPWLRAFGLIASVLGLLLILLSSYQLIIHGGGSPNPLLAPPKQLVTHGLYAYLRHPMYTGFIALAFGYGVLLDSLSFTVFFAPLVLFALLLRAYLEERSLCKVHGDLYHRYRLTTPGFIPRWPKGEGL